MGAKFKNYELSLWLDRLDTQTVDSETTTHFFEKRRAIIGSNAMIAQNRARNVKLVENINGTTTLTFTLYTHYQDYVTGEEVENPFASYIKNEAKLKLKIWNNNPNDPEDVKWYDYIVKSVKQDSVKYTLEVTATDQYINELSRNGFNLTLDPELENNLGSIQEIAANVLEDTDWIVPKINVSSCDFPIGSGSSTTTIVFEPSEFIADRKRETLVQVTLSSNITANQIDDDNPDGSSTSTSLTSGSTVYLYYSDCNEEIVNFPKGLEFIYAGNNPLEYDYDGVVTSKGVHYLCSVTTGSVNSSYGIFLPDWVNNNDSNISIVTDFRGAKFSYKTVISYNPVLEQYVTEYKGPERTTGKILKSASSITVIDKETGELKTLPSEVTFRVTNEYETSAIYGYFSPSTTISQPKSYFYIPSIICPNSSIVTSGPLNGYLIQPYIFTKIGSMATQKYWYMLPDDQQSEDQVTWFNADKETRTFTRTSSSDSTIDGYLLPSGYTAIASIVTNPNLTSSINFTTTIGFVHQSFGPRLIGSVVSTPSDVSADWFNKEFIIPLQSEYGDVDGDGYVTTTDARLVLQRATNKLSTDLGFWENAYYASSLVSSEDSKVRQYAYIPSGSSIDTTAARLTMQAAVGKYSDFIKTRHRITFSKESGGHVYGLPNGITFGAVSSETTNNSIYYEYSTTKYDAPILVQDCVTPFQNFKDNGGWRIGLTSSPDTGGIELITESGSNWSSFDTDNTTLVSDLVHNQSIGQQYVSYIQVKNTSNVTGYLCNTGFFDNRLTIGNICNGEKYCIELESACNDGSVTTSYIGSFTYNYSDSTVPFQFSDIHFVEGLPSSSSSTTFEFENCDFSDKQFSEQKEKIGIFYEIPPGATYRIKKLRVYKAITDKDGEVLVDENGKFITPESQPIDAQATTTHWFYSALDLAYYKTKDDLPIAGKYQTIPPEFTTEYKCQKRRAITAKESNYFNIIQSLCEKFECWARFNIARDDKGAIIGKYVTFHNYAGHAQYAGFRYGVNLTSVQRTQDSKSIVTKLIVKQNSNEFGKNGFCTIARALANETGETWIQNFDHYINTGLLLKSDLNMTLYGPDDAFASDSSGSLSTDFILNGYYPKLKALNAQIMPLNEAWTADSLVLGEANAKVATYQAGLDAANETFLDKSEYFKKRYRFDYTKIYEQTPGDVPAGSVTSADFDPSGGKPECVKDITGIAEALQQVTNFTSELIPAKQLQKDYQAKVDEEAEKLRSLRESKNNLHKIFYSKYYRFIQEGTWNSEEYYDDEKYYLDALSTGINSSKPQITYSISVLELSQLNGYEDFTFKVGDKTYVEDPEFFGYDENNSPRREEVVLTELTYVLDDPSKNSIKVQNYRSQFQDLFKKTAATVQQVQFSTGKYDKASIFSETNDAGRAELIQGAINTPDLILQNAGEQSVRLDKSGLTIADMTDKSKLLRAVGGGFLMSDNGGDTWHTAITAAGINAKYIKTGQLDTDLIKIFNGDQVTFRWDAYGLTAYDFETNNGVISSVNENAGVRFDKLGIYGFSIPDDADIKGSNWAPNKVAEWWINEATGQYEQKPDDEHNQYVRNHSMFELTEMGLYLAIGQQKNYHYINSNNTYTTLTDPIITKATLKLGQVDDLVYNTWDTNKAIPTPYYAGNKTPFSEVLNVSSNTQTNSFRIFSDGSVFANNTHIGNDKIFLDVWHTDQLYNNMASTKLQWSYPPSISSKNEKDLNKEMGYVEFVFTSASTLTLSKDENTIYFVTPGGSVQQITGSVSIQVRPSSVSERNRVFYSINTDTKQEQRIIVLSSPPTNTSGDFCLITVPFHYSHEDEGGSWNLVSTTAIDKEYDWQNVYQTKHFESPLWSGSKICYCVPMEDGLSTGNLIKVTDEEHPTSLPNYYYVLGLGKSTDDDEFYWVFSNALRQYNATFFTLYPNNDASSTEVICTDGSSPSLYVYGISTSSGNIKYSLLEPEYFSYKRTENYIVMPNYTILESTIKLQTMNMVIDSKSLNPIYASDNTYETEFRLISNGLPITSNQTKFLTATCVSTNPLKWIYEWKTP